MGADKEIFLVAQLDPAQDDPQRDDLYDMGVVATILQLLKLPDGTVRVLVENTGRINFSHQLLGERKGILKYEPAAGEPAPTKWQMFPLPMDNLASLKFTKKPCTGPCFYRSTFNVDAPADTFIDTSQLTKGQLWINGHTMGRFWNIGPQKTLYVPGPWLKQGTNEIVVFDVNGSSDHTVEGLTKPNLGN